MFDGVCDGELRPSIKVTQDDIIVRSERRLPHTKGISEYPRMGSSLGG